MDYRDLEIQRLKLENESLKKQLTTSEDSLSFLELVKKHNLEQDCFDIIRAALVSSDVKLKDKARIVETVLARTTPTLKAVTHTMREPIQIIIHSATRQAREVIEDRHQQAIDAKFLMLPESKAS